MAKQEFLNSKISPQRVLGVFCLVLFLSVGMLFSNISILELNCCKCEGRQVFTIFEGKMYGRVLFTLFRIIIEGPGARRAYMGNSTYWTLHSEGK